MILLVVLLTLSLLVVLEAAWVALDGSGPDAPPRSHHEDAQFLPPAHH